MALTQWVNLPKENIFKDKDIDSTDRCGTITIEVEVEKADSAIAYKAKIIPSGTDDVTYNSKELSRNTNFKIQKGIGGIVDTKKIRLQNIRLPAAGGNKYNIEVEDAAGNVVSTPVEVEAKRRLYYQVLTMDDKKGNMVPAYSLANMESHGKKYFIELEKKGTKEKVPYIKTLKTFKYTHPEYNLNQFATDVVKSYTIDDKYKQLGMAAVFSEYISTFKDDKIIRTVTIGTPNPLCIWGTTAVTVMGDRWLWHGLDDADDAAKKWFISGYVVYTDPAKPAIREEYKIDRANVRITGKPRFTHGGYHQVKIKIDPALQALLSKKQGQLEFTIDVNIIAGFTNGFSWNPRRGVNLITCARRTLWTDMPANTREYTWNHEVGHRFGMTAWGNSKYGNKALRDKLPDGPPTLYGENRGVNDKTHSGPHCEKGASFDAVKKKWSGTPGCVMFGANGTSTAHSPNDYCSECAPIVRKVDLSS